MQTVSIIGAGRLGGALAIALSAAGYSIEHLIYRTGFHDDLLDFPQLRGRAGKLEDAVTIRSDVLIISTSDTEMEAAGRSVAPLLDLRTAVLHTSGSLSSKVLAAVAEKGNETGSMHPLLSVSSPRTGAAAFPGAFFCLEGGDGAISAAREIVRSLGGSPFSVATDFKPLYHASAVLASGHLVALFQTAVDVLASCGLEGRSPAEVLLPLVESTVNNLKAQSPGAALTGPFARADSITVERHLAALEAAGLGNIRRLYLELGLTAIGLAEQGNATAAEIDALRETIKLAQASAKC